MKSLYLLLLLYVLVGCGMAQDKPVIGAGCLQTAAIQIDTTAEGVDVICIARWEKLTPQPPVSPVPQCSADMPHCVIGDPAPWLYVPQQWDTPFTCTYVLQTHTFQADLKAPASEPFDVPAVRKPRNEEYAKVCADNKLAQGQYPTIYKTLCSEDAIAPWTCADHRRTLLPDQQTPPKWHCYAMWQLGGK